MARQLLVLFDGNAIVHRAYHAFQGTKYRRGTTLTVSNTGEVVSAVYGFVLMLLKVLNEQQPTHYAIAFDKRGPTFRHHLFEDYKANRPATPDDLISQIARVKDLVSVIRIPVFEIDSFEADDVLGALSQQASRQNIETVIVTGDADTMQLVSPLVKVLYPKPGKSFSETILFDEDSVSQKYGVGPEHITDLKALEGDTSDNIPGVPGIGGKTAVKLIQQFGSLEDIYNHIDEVTPPRLQTLLRDNEEVAYRSKKLATIVKDVPVTLHLADCEVNKFDRKQVADAFRELEFFSLLSKLPGAEEPAADAAPVQVATGPPDGKYQIVATTEALDDLVKRLSSVKSFAFDTETTGLNPMTAGLVGISISPEPGEAYYVPVGHTILDEVVQLPLEQVINRLKPVFEEAKTAKIGHNAKYDMMMLAGLGITVNNLAFDTMIAAYLLGDKYFNLKGLAFSRLGIEMVPITALIGTGAKQIVMSQVPIRQAADYACADADMTLRLENNLKEELEDKQLWQLFSQVEMPLVPILLDMERNGIALDTGILRNLSQQLGEQLSQLETEIYAAADGAFNINSPQQLGKVLFDKLQLPNTRRGKSKYSTEASVLEELGKDYPIVKLILQYRQLMKLKSTYLDTLPALVNPTTGRVHTSFNQTRAVTGRLSSSDPNMQNIPVRGGMGGQVRQAFIAPAGSYLLSGDYSQIDLRVLAHLSQDPGLLAAFQQDEDIHAATAAGLFGVKPSQVTPDMRRLAKTVNFGVIYGMSDYGLEQATELTRQEASQFISTYFEKYKGVKEYLDSTKEQARRNGYVQTLMGRRRYIPDINAPNRQVREAAERMAINMPVQGTSADIIKVAMINLAREMKERGVQSKMLLQVHDELVLEVPEAEMHIMRKLVPEVMSAALRLSIPLKVDIKEGKNWAETK
jgi:DNA polymerase-1